MKKIFRRLACCSFLSIASIGCFEVDARLPKYMAQRAAELLIEKSGLVLQTTHKKFAKDLVDLLYSTENRRELAKWFKEAYDNGYKDIKVSDASDDIKKIIMKVKGIDNDSVFNGEFVNRHFPCWTGTLTCFMLAKNNKAREAVMESNIKTICRDSITHENSVKKFVGILFALELVDNWKDVQEITDSSESEPKLQQNDPCDPYDCVPVPNTVYKTDDSSNWNAKNTQGSCMVSTIRNLLYILCRNSQESKPITTNTNWREDMQNVFGDEFYTVPGTTSCKTLGEFAKKILPNITKRYQPTLELFVCTLNSLLRESAQEKVVIPTPNQYIYEPLGTFKTVIENILRKLTCHEQLTVTFDNSDFEKFKGWPEQRLIIRDEIVNKTIIIAFGHRGPGQHIEIIDIKPANRPR